METPTLEERIEVALAKLAEGSPETWVGRAEGRALFNETLAALREKDARIAATLGAIAQMHDAGGSNGHCVCVYCEEYRAARAKQIEAQR
jgi:hypothetical protein